MYFRLNEQKEFTRKFLQRIFISLLIVTYVITKDNSFLFMFLRLTIDTLQELVDAKLSYGGWGEINRDFFQKSLDQATQIIGSKFEMINDSDIAVDRVANGNFAFYENIFYLKYVSVQRQFRLQTMRENRENYNNIASSINDNVGNRNLHIMNDCVINMPISIGLQKNSPILRRFNKYVRRIIEAGLVMKWLDNVMQTTLQADNSEIKKNEKAIMNFSKMIGAFVALFIGYFLSLLVLVVEIVYYRHFVRKHPKFDKYNKTIRY